MSATRVLIADPRPLMRSVLAEALATDGTVAVVATTGDASATTLQTERLRPDVVLLSTALDVASLSRSLRATAGDCRVVAVADDGVPGDLLEAVEAGVDGYVTGAAGLDGLLEAVGRVMAGESVIPPAMLGPLLRQLIERRRQADRATEALLTLTKREREILALLVEGLDQDGIAERLTISPETARTHIQRVLRKLDVRSRVEAVALAVEHGLVDRLELVTAGNHR